MPQHAQEFFIAQPTVGRRIATLEKALALVPLPLDTWRTLHEDLRHTPCCKVTFEALLQGLQRHLGA